MTLTTERTAEYETTYATMTIRQERRPELKWILGRLLKPAAKQRYVSLGQTTGVPWYVIGILHMLEASGNFDRHLHNGDPLTARTVQKPAGRPEKGPANGKAYTWEESAADALAYDQVSQNTDWSIGGLAYVFERYNGPGYRKIGTPSPYLWSFSTAYSAGKYKSDGHYDPKLVSQQAGAMVLLKALVEAGEIAAPASGGHVGPITLLRENLPLSGDDAPAPASAPPAYPGHYIHIDVEAPAEVRQIQARLRSLGIDPRGIDGDFGPDTEAAVRQFQARSVDPAGIPLEVDGIVGPDTWEALFGQGSVKTSPELGGAPTQLTVAVLAVAADEVGVREEPLGSNRGQRVDQYMNATDPSQLGGFWCCAFVYWCFRQAAADIKVPNPFPKTAGVLYAWSKAAKIPGVEIVTAAQAKADPSRVKPGAVFFISTGKGYGHTGIVEANNNGTLVTIEGNTNSDGSSNGIGVFRRTQRRVSQINEGFAHFG